MGVDVRGPHDHGVILEAQHGRGEPLDGRVLPPEEAAERQEHRREAR